MSALGRIRRRIHSAEFADDPAEFSRVLDRAEATDLRTWSLPEEYLAEWEGRKAAGKPLPRLGTGSRGPATIMSSILKPETLFLWFYDHPDLMHRFRDILAAKMVEFNTVLRKFSGTSSSEDGNTEPGWWITDDNSALFNRKLYREYCYPELERVLNAMAPGDARCYQHSDSAMGHLLDMQYALSIRDVNYGPTVDAALIREKMPDALINGQMPPMLLRDGRPEEIRARVIKDFRKAGGNGRLNVTTAGSLAAGTGVGRMRWFMQVVQEYCRQWWWYHSDIATKKHWYGEPWGGPDTHLARPFFVSQLEERVKEYHRWAEDPKADLTKLVGTQKTHEQQVPIMDGLTNNNEGYFQVNVPNHGALAGIPDDVVVEVPAIVNAKGIQPLRVGSLPPKIIFECILPAWLDVERELLAFKTGDQSMQLFETLNNHQTRSYDAAVALLDELIHMPEVAEVEDWEKMERIQDHYKYPARL